MRALVRLTLAMLIAVAAGMAFGQAPDARRPDAGRMSGEDRQRFREDLQRQPVDPRQGAGDQNNAERARRYAEWQRMSPEQREGIRRDMRDYNRDHDRRR